MVVGSSEDGSRAGLAHRATTIQCANSAKRNKPGDEEWLRKETQGSPGKWLQDLASNN
jgi:hypothetical protein